MRCSAPTKNSAVILSSLILIAGILMTFTSAPPARAAGELSWVDARGPGNGNSMALACDNAHGILYRAVTGNGGNSASGKGVWKYQAGEWTPLGGEVACMGINTLAYDSAGDRLYAGSNGQGVWCYDPSTGQWAETHWFVRGYYITALAFGGGKLYAGLWDPAPPPETQGKGVWCFDPADPGAGWTDTGGGVAAFRVESLAWGDGLLYAGPVDRTSGWQAKGVWYYDPASADADKWTDTAGGMTNGYAAALAWDGANNLLYSSAGNTGAFRYYPASTDVDKWTYIGGGFSNFQVTSLAWGEGKLYAASNDAGTGEYKGVWCYNPATSGWSDTGGGMDSFEIKSLAFSTFHHHLFAGTTLNGVWLYNLSDNPPAWSDTQGGVSTSYVDRLAYDAAGRMLYVGTIGEGVWRYDPATAEWTDTGGSLGTFQITSLAFGGGKLYAGCFDPYTSAYVGVWCYDPLSPDADKWTDTGSTAPAVHDLIYDPGSDLLYAGTGEYYSASGGQGVWCYDPASPGWTDIGSGDIDDFYINSLALSEDSLYAGCYDPGSGYVGAWQYDPDNSSAGWSSTGGSASTYRINALAWGGDRLYAGCWDMTQPIYDQGKGVWCYDPSSPAPDKWTDTGGTLSDYKTYSLAWDGSKLYAGVWNRFTTQFDGVWGYDPASPETNKWWDTAGATGGYYVPSLLYDEACHRLYAGTEGGGAWYYGEPPVVASLDPGTGTAGSEVVVHGSCFGPGGTGTEYVTFGGVPAVVKPGTWTDGSLVCNVPAGVSGTVPVVVHNINGASNAVNFNVIAQHTITASVSGGHGEVSPASQKVVHGASASIDLIPDSGYHAASITDNGAAKPVADPYVIDNVQEDHTVVVTFAEDEPPVSSVWYLAEGCTEGGMETWVLVQNPGDAEVKVDLTFMTGSGPVDGPQGFAIPAGSRTSFNANLFVTDYNVSTKVEATGGSVICERAMYGGNRTWAHDSIGVAGSGFLSGWKFCIDPGHGGGDPGAIGPTGLEEKNVNLDVSMMLRDLLLAQGAEVLMTREDDSAVSISQRWQMANDWEADRFISIHHNAVEIAEVNGTETWVHYDASPQAVQLAGAVQEELVDELGLPDRGVKRTLIDSIIDFDVLKFTIMPAVLTEASFLSNPAEEQRLRDDLYLMSEVRAIMRGICSESIGLYLRSLFGLGVRSGIH
jgi:N-acetylmuramoyl-L-alanine amidase